jgi:SOS-response transcriptional repressor LexA
MKKPTKKQLLVYEFLCQYVEENSCSPTIKEISEHFGEWQNATFECLLSMEEKGMIKRHKPKGADGYAARSISPLKDFK